jgi:hypothetical protein
MTLAVSGLWLEAVGQPHAEHSRLDGMDVRVADDTAGIGMLTDLATKGAPAIKVQ